MTIHQNGFFYNISVDSNRIFNLDARITINYALYFNFSIYLYNIKNALQKYNLKYIHTRSWPHKNVVTTLSQYVHLSDFLFYTHVSYFWIGLNHIKSPGNILICSRRMMKEIKIRLNNSIVFPNFKQLLLLYFGVNIIVIFALYSICSCVTNTCYKI